MTPFEQLPSVLIANGTFEVEAGGATLVEDGLKLDVKVLILEVEGFILVIVLELETGGKGPLPALYQFVFGSPKHSPTVTDLNPLLCIDAKT